MEGKGIIKTHAYEAIRNKGAQCYKPSQLKRFLNKKKAILFKAKGDRVAIKKDGFYYILNSSINTLITVLTEEQWFFSMKNYKN